MTATSSINPGTSQDTTRLDDSDEYTSAMVYGYGTAAVAIISSLALLGILLFPTLKNRSHVYVLQFFIALGVGTMAADALIHVIPDVIGLPGADDEGDDGEHTIIVWEMSAVFGGIYIFFFLENGLKALRRYRAIKNKVIHRDGTEAEVYGNKSVVESSPDLENSEDSETVNIPPDEIDEHHDRVCLGFNTVILTVFVGDALHNITDGIAIGVSFAESATAGIGTTIAVLFHEIPHELGDFAIFIQNGASKWKAIGLNLSAACFAFIGLYLGIAVGQNEAARLWILAFVAGTFLYIALVQVMSEMTRQLCENPALQFLLQNIGLLLGWTVMLLLGLYEGAIEESFS